MAALNVGRVGGAQRVPAARASEWGGACKPVRLRPTAKGCGQWTRLTDRQTHRVAADLANLAKGRVYRPATEAQLAAVIQQ